MTSSMLVLVFGMLPGFAPIKRTSRSIVKAGFLDLDFEVIFKLFLRGF